MGQKSRKKKERRLARKYIQENGEKVDIANKEVKKIILPEEFTSKFPNETLVVNPLNSDIPEEQKVVVDMKYAFGHDLVAFVRFKGAAIHIGHPREKKCAYQIAVVQADRSAPWRGKANFMTDPVYIETNDLDLARDAMLEDIRRDKTGLIYQVQERIASSLRKAKIDKSMGKKVDMPWYVMSVSEMSKISSFVKGDK